MAGISILVVFFVFMVIMATSVAGVVLFILAMVLFRKAKSPHHNGKVSDGKRKAAVILVISLLLLLPLVIFIISLAIGSRVEKVRKREAFEAIEIKVTVQEDWKKGFEYDGKTLVPVNFLMNPSKELEYIGALVTGDSYDFHSFYHLINESGFPLYYVHVSGFAYGEYFSRTFVDEDDYDAVMDYYCNSELSVSALWKTAPENSSLGHEWKNVDLNINDQRDEFVSLFHEVLDDVSDKRQESTSAGDEYDCVLYNIKSRDGVFSVDLCVNTKDDELLLYVNDYKVEDEIAERYKEMLLSFVRDTKAELLYTAFLRNEIRVPNPFVPGDELSFFDDRVYAQDECVFENAAKYFSLVDVNHDGVSELIFRIYSSPDELMYILGVQGDQLVCFDIMLTHTVHMAFGIYDNGIVNWGQNYDGEEDVYYSYDSDGSPHELIHFVGGETDIDSGLRYDYYYLDGDETTKCSLQSNEEYENLISGYKGEEPEWFPCDSPVDISFLHTIQAVQRPFSSRTGKGRGDQGT